MVAVSSCAGLPVSGLLIWNFSKFYITVAVPANRAQVIGGCIAQVERGLVVWKPANLSPVVPRMLTTTIVYVIAVLAAFVVSRVEGSTYYSASTSNAYTWARFVCYKNHLWLYFHLIAYTSYQNRSYPQSCSCQQDGVTTSTCTYYACNCACDLTAGVCDFNCCCDPDCSSSQVLET